MKGIKAWSERKHHNACSLSHFNMSILILSRKEREKKGGREVSEQKRCGLLFH